MVRIVLSYLNQNTPNSRDFNDSVAGMAFEDFLNSDYVEHNLLTRSLLCKKPDDNLTHVDLEYAKYFILRKCQVKFYYTQDYERALSDIRSIIINENHKKDGSAIYGHSAYHTDYMPSTDENIMRCMSYDLSNNWIKHAPSKIEKLVLDYSGAMLERNNYDMELYSLAVGLHSEFA